MLSNRDITTSLVSGQYVIFEKDNEKYFKFLKVSSASRRILLSGYRMLVGACEIKPLEQVDHERKLSIWKTACDYTQREFSKEDTMDYARCAYLIQSI